jgi:asparagine synthase (glutamine-hydrolysing)
MLGIDFRFVLADGDLPKVTRMCELAGVDVGFPMLDQELVAFSAELPPDLKLRRTHLRWFFKQALSEFLPPQIIAKKKHGFGLPVGVWLASHRPLFDLARASLDRLRSRRIVQPAFLDHLSERLLLEHSGYYGVLVWVLMVLSLWLDSRRL